MAHRPKSRYRQMNPAVARCVRRLYFINRLKQREIADIFGVKQNTVSRIVSGITWSEAGE